MTQRIGVVSDTHVPSIYRTIPDDLWRGLEGCDRVIHAGDFDSWETYEAFKREFPVTAVIGNRDEFRECEEIPNSQVIEAGGFTIGVTHGWGPKKGLPERVYHAWEGGPVDLLVFGHSHLPGIHTIDGLRLLNPGSPTDTISAERQTFALLEIGDTIEIAIHHLGG
jgi:putative phosphoesterase